jgi:hypothetical protein
VNLSDRFDVHDHRHGLKLLAEDRETTHLENREPFDGPDVRRRHLDATLEIPNERDSTTTHCPL